MEIQAETCIEQQPMQAELDRILASESFLRAPTLARLLRYLCTATLQGKGDTLKEYAIGLEVFHRGSGYQPELDSIVRVEVNRLRQRLRSYYEGEGQSNPARISIPVGRYVALCAANSLCIADPHPRIWHKIKYCAKVQWPWAAGFFLACTLLFALWGWHSHTANPPSANKNTPTTAAFDDPIGPPAGDELRILAGSQRAHLDHAGQFWQSDRYYTGGHSEHSSERSLLRTPDPEIFRTCRKGNFRYDIPLHPGRYELRLYFAESEYAPITDSNSAEGIGLMQIRANGNLLERSLDVVSDAGNTLSADVKVYSDLEPANDGKLHLDFSATGGSEAILSAIEIRPGIKGHIRPVRILPRQTPYYSNDSKIWEPDNFYLGGRMRSTLEPIAGVDDPELYAGERWGNFSYQIPVTKGRYTVTLYFAEHSSAASSGAPDATHADQVFSVFCNGVLALQNLDLHHEAHRTHTYTRRIENVEANAQGKILLSFQPVRGYASVSGIEVIAATRK